MKDKNETFQLPADQSTPLIQRTISCPCDGGCPRCATQAQTNMNVGHPNDAHEHEADKVAEQVMRMPQPVVQRQCCEEEEESVQTKSSGGPSPQQNIGSKVQFHASNCPGKPLHDSTLNFFGPRFGNDFSNVRVHTCDSAVQMSKELSAQAFTYGNAIFFNSGKYDPESFQGKQLLGHELTHVVQQNNNVIRRKSATIVCDGEGDYEGDLRGYAKAICDLDYCVGLHEGVHCDDWRERWPNGSRRADGTPRPRGAKVPTGGAGYDMFLRNSECRAWDVTRRCVKSLIPDSEGDCRKKLKAELRTAKIMKEHYCK